MSCLSIQPDPDPINPRNFDNFCTIITGNRSYGGGDESYYDEGPFEQALLRHAKDIQWSKKNGLYHVITAYIHSGIAVRLDDYGNWPDQRWDCMPFGVMFVSPSKVRKFHHWKRISRRRLELLKTYLQNEFNEWASWISGDCYMVIDTDTNIVEFDGNYHDCMDYIANDPSDNNF